MANFVLIVLSMTIGLFFILMGTIKLTPAISEEVYREMVRHGDGDWTTCRRGRARPRGGGDYPD